MSHSYWGYWLIVMGVSIVGLMMAVNGLTTTSTQDYLNIKETAEQAMLLAVDYAYYRDYNEIKMNKEKFMEIFLEAFSMNNQNANGTYKVNFYGIYEAPPKVSVEVLSNSGANYIPGRDEYDTVTRYDAIILVHAAEVGSSGSGEAEPEPTPDEPSDEPDEPEPEVTSACKDGIDTSLDAKGLKAYPMSAIAVYDSKEHNNQIGTTKTNNTDTEEFEILGMSDSDSRWWAVKSDNYDCGWIDSNYVAVDITAFTGITTSIFNASTSKYQSHNKPLNLGQLYNSSYKPIAVYSFAKKLLTAKQNADAAGVKLIINDAYRPHSVTLKLKSAFENLVESDPVVNAYVNDDTFATGDFVALGTSAHNTACAVDIVFEGASTPSAMHELGPWAALRPDKSKLSTNSDVLKLHNIMTNGTELKDLSSEWWHYQDNDCHHRITGVSSTGATFWAK